MPDSPPRTQSPGRLIAHRGASLTRPENTLAAFEEAAAQGAAWVEFDVSLLGDGTAVIHHDAALGRCVPGSAPLSTLVKADLGRLEAGSRFGAAWAGEPLPRLSEALARIGALGLSANLEMKLHGAAPSAMAAAVDRALSRHAWAEARVLVSSFEHAALAALRALRPRQPIALLYGTPPEDWPAACRSLGASGIHIDYRALRESRIARAARHGLDIRVYTVNRPGLMAPFRALGLSGVITDHPPFYLADAAWQAWAAADA